MPQPALLTLLYFSLLSHSHALQLQSGEETSRQLASRAVRMGLRNGDKIALRNTCDVGDVLDTVQRVNPRCVIVDSIQTMFLEEATGFAGSVAQLRECTRAINQVAKATGIPIFLVGHVTKVMPISVDQIRCVKGAR